jgi:hypothetical protein
MQLQVTFLFDEKALKRLQNRVERTLEHDGAYDALLELLTRMTGGQVFKREDYEAARAAASPKGKRKTKRSPDADRQPQAGRARR